MPTNTHPKSCDTRPCFSHILRNGLEPKVSLHPVALMILTKLHCLATCSNEGVNNLPEIITQHKPNQKLNSQLQQYRPETLISHTYIHSVRSDKMWKQNSHIYMKCTQFKFLHMHTYYNNTITDKARKAFSYCDSVECLSQSDGKTNAHTATCRCTQLPQLFSSHWQPISGPLHFHHCHSITFAPLIHMQTHVCIQRKVPCDNIRTETQSLATQ